MELQAVVDPGPFVRCITFKLWDCDGGDPAAEVSVDMTFIGGVAMDNFVVPCGNYTCITARDELHTLRRTISPIPLEAKQYVADFVFADGKDLIGGNLNDDLFIDVLDFGTFAGQFGTNFGNGDTFCPPVGPHADISGNGLVGVEDFTFITLNFLESHEPNCCGAPLMAGDLFGPVSRDWSRPVTRISVKELRTLGLLDMIRADLNGDGWVDEADIEAFLNGARPNEIGIE